MTTNNNLTLITSGAASPEWMKMRREKRRERRRCQMERFFDSVAAQNTEKIICIFDPDLNIA